MYPATEPPAGADTARPCNRRGGRRALLASALAACVTGLGFFGGCMPMPRAALDQMQPPPTQQVVTRDGGGPVQVVALPDAGGVLMVVPPSES